MKKIFKLTVTKGDFKLYFACLVAALAVIACSGLDLAISQLFYTKADGFYLKDDSFYVFFHKTWPMFIYGLPALCVGMWLGGKINKQSVCAVKGKTLAYILTSFIVIPGLVINTLFKGFWGRERPRNITEFGGAGDYTSPFVISDTCTSNCSFPSGHVSLAVWCLALALVLPKPLRKLGIFLVLVMSATVAYTRIVMGAHFLSDTIFALLIVAPLVVLLWRSFGLDKEEE